MDKSIYENRADEINGMLSSLYHELDCTTDEDERKSIKYDISTFSKLEEANAKILIEIERNSLKDKELDSSDVISDEKHKIEKEQNRLRDRELDIRESENLHSKELHDRELEIKERESVQSKELREWELKIRECENAEAARRRQDEWDIRSSEHELKEKELNAKAESDKAKIESDEKDSKRKLIGEGLKVGASIIGVVGSVFTLGQAMKFEKMDNGGILPTKFINSIFRMTGI